MTEEDEHPLATARAVTRILDSSLSIPGTRFRLGLDPIIGLIPGLGDVAGTALGGYLVLLGARIGAPGSVVARMLLNVGIDAVVGAVPVIGDVFDFVWKANSRNLALLELYLERPIDTRRSSRMVLIGAGLGIGALVAGAGVLAFLALRAIVGVFG